MENKIIAPKEKEHMQTLVSCLNYLYKSGYQTQFKATTIGLLSLATEKIFQPTQIRIVHFYRFEGESNPSDNAILYAIETNDEEKGTLVNGYGPSSDSLVNEFMEQVEKIHQ